MHCNLNGLDRCACSQTTILVLHGFSRTASENDLLGQFDIINIPPMPKVCRPEQLWPDCIRLTIAEPFVPFQQYYPKIEVTFHLDKNDILTAEARDLDGPRHKAWRAAGGAIVLRKP